MLLMLYVATAALLFYGYTYQGWGSWALISLLAATGGTTEQIVKLVRRRTRN